MRFRQRSGLSVRLVDGEVVILDREAQRIHQLNSTASFVWNRLDGRCDLAAVARELSLSFDVTEDVASRDVARIVEELRDLELVEPVAAGHE